MPLDPARARQRLNEFNLKALFVEELGWDHHAASHQVTVDGRSYQLNAVAHKRGFAAFTCEPGPDGRIPDYATRRKVDRQVTKIAHEHLVIFVNADKTTQIWQWLKKEPGKPFACRERAYYRGQPGDAVIQPLQLLTFSIEEEAGLALPDVTIRVRAALDLEKVTRRFYDRFKDEHAAFLKFLKGIPDEEMQRWYVSVMLNRLMFIYFIQKKGFLDSNQNYLRVKLDESKKRGKDRFYKDFLSPLFFEGFATKEGQRSAATNKLLGKVPYLNGGLFLRHQIEELYGSEIQIGDGAFEKLFAFFEQYHWHLDERPLKADNEINPDVLGYIFEKYVNQKQMGAYYSKEDITGYISQNTVIPYLFDQARKECKIAFEGAHSIWRLLQADPDRYIYDAVKKGVHLKLPTEIDAGLKDVSKRTEWNKPAPEEYALPTEIWREVVARRKRYEEVRDKLAAGAIRSLNDLITYNLDIRQFAQDVIETCEGPELLRAFYKAIKSVSVLDPACGSGAFLFAALNILESLYEACLDRMEVFLEELERSGQKHRPEKFADFKKELERVAAHPNRKYFIYKGIIVNNLFGVDIMEEATEICKLRLFLKLVAQIERLDQIEPLPDIDFNIRAGNTLVGYASYDDVKRAVTSKLDFEKTMDRIEEKAQDIDRLFALFREMQSDQRMESKEFAQAKQDLLQRLKVLEDELNRYLAGEYGVKSNDRPSYERWLASHKPFHWFIEFYRILKHGGFDAVIGNPPYVEYQKVQKDYRIRGYGTESCGNLYAFMMERSAELLSMSGVFGMIVPAGLMGLDETAPLRSVLLQRYGINCCSTYSIRPSKLFDGVDQRLCIFLGRGTREAEAFIWTSKYHHWHAEERPALFARIEFVQSLQHKRLNRIPQVGSANASNILSKLEAKSPKTIASYYAGNRSGFLMHYHRSPRYWIRAMDFEPHFKSPTRERSVHHFRDLYFADKTAAKVAGAILNSSLFFFWFITVGNGRNITGTDVEQFPIGNATGGIASQLPRLFDSLMKDYQRNSFIRVRQDCEFQEFRPSLSKPVIDEIDLALSAHYGFSPGETDFVINYDIKYRMGDELEEVED